MARVSLKGCADEGGQGAYICGGLCRTALIYSRRPSLKAGGKTPGSRALVWLKGSEQSMKPSVITLCSRLWMRCAAASSPCHPDFPEIVHCDLKSRAKINLSFHSVALTQGVLLQQQRRHRDGSPGSSALSRSGPDSLGNHLCSSRSAARRVPPCCLTQAHSTASAQ